MYPRGPVRSSGPADGAGVRACGSSLKLYSMCFWAFDQFCLNSRPVPLEVVGAVQVIGARTTSRAPPAPSEVGRSRCEIVAPAGGALNRFKLNERKLNG